MCISTKEYLNLNKIPWRIEENNVGTDDVSRISSQQINKNEENISSQL